MLRDLLSCSRAALAILVRTPREDVARLGMHDRMVSTTADTQRLQVEKRVNEDRTELLLEVGLVHPQLPVSITAHSVAQLRSCT